MNVDVSPHERVRPTAPRWSHVEIGDEIDGPGRWLDWTATVLQVSGSQDWNRVHHDPDYARQSGHGGTFFNTGWTAAMLSRLVTDWMGPFGWLSHLEIRMGRMNVPGDTVQARGRVTEKWIDPGGDHIVVLDVWLDNDRRGVTTTGTAIVRLPQP